jgi:CRISPR-associated protein (TIGR02584 family)
MTGPSEVVLFAPIGPNPAPLTELVWALHRQRGLVVREAFVVVDSEARHFFDDEVLAAGAALDELHEVLGPAVFPRDGIHVREARIGGELLADDRDPADARVYADVAWHAARDAVAAAGARAVVFALVGGRRRTITALATVTAQLLARPADLCVDVRLGDERVAGGSGFFFPEQKGQLVLTPRGPVRAAEVEILLVDVRLPRLRGLLTAGDLASYEEALAAGQRAIDAALPSRLTIDLVAGTAEIDGLPLGASEGELVWLATLATARLDGADGWVASGDTAPLAQLLSACAAYGWSARIKSKALRTLMGEVHDGYDADGMDADLAKLRADAKRRLAAFCRAHRPAAARWLVPAARKAWHDGALTSFQRLPAAPEQLLVSGRGRKVT